MHKTHQQTREHAMIRNRVVESIKNENMSAKEATISSQADRKKFVSDGVFPLFSLPTELQNIVYQFVVSEPEKVIKLDNVETPALARVNKYLRKAVLPIFLSSNTFRLFTEEAPSRNSQSKDAKFKIQASVLEWLSPFGHHTPLFKSLVIHFGVDNDTELVLKHSRQDGGFKVTHDLVCIYCHELKSTFPTHPALPRALLEKCSEYTKLCALIDLAEERHTAMMKEHQITVADIEAEVFSNMTGIRKNSKGLSMANVMGLQRVVNQGKMIFAVAVHTINMKRLLEAPLFVETNGVQYALRRDTSA